MADNPMPAIFFGHGSPMNAVGGPYAESWRAIGKAMPRPKAILMVSAHWFVEGTAVTAQPSPRTIHDFYGFPPELYAVQYPAPGSSALVARVRDLVGAGAVAEDQEWGLDHGTWSVLVHVYPGADIPVVQLSLDMMKPAADHYALAQALGPLRDEGVLIAGSGNIVHNLRVIRWEGGAGAYDWAERFNTAAKRAIETRDHAALIDYERLAEGAKLAVPTPEHYLPLLYVLAQQRPGEAASFFNDRIDLGSISMLGVKIG